MKNLNFFSQSEISTFWRYVKDFNCSIFEAIADRDYPLTPREVRVLLIQIGFDGSDTEVEKCRPDSEESVVKQRLEFDEEARR